MMLNFTATKGTPGAGFVWTNTISYTTEESMLTWIRAHDTLVSTASGTDPHGWRNGLNYYGWHSYTNPATMVYKDQSYSTYDAAVKAAIMALARYNKPVGILGWAGTHAQFINGYDVYGQDPAISADFTVTDIYLTDPLAKDALRNVRINNNSFANGSLVYRFRAYTETDSPYADPYGSTTTASYREWYGKWVIVAPVR